MQNFLLFMLFIMSVSCGVAHKYTVEARGPGCIRIRSNQPSPPFISFEFLAIKDLKLFPSLSRVNPSLH